MAADGTTDNSPYTAALAAAIREPGLRLEQVFKRVRVAVETATGEQQTPWEESSLKGDFYFIPQGPTVTVTPPGAPPAQAPPTFDARALELAFWNSIEKGADPADFEDYLARYPDGLFSGLAKRRLAAVTEVAALPPAEPPPTQYAMASLQEIQLYIENAKDAFKQAINKYWMAGFDTLASGYTHVSSIRSIFDATVIGRKNGKVIVYV